MILDLHIHSKFSFDSLLKPKNIIYDAKKKGLAGIAITDHDTIKGAIEAKKTNSDPDFFVIVGTEIATEIGDIMGLFLENEIESRFSLDVIDEIHSQDGISALPHPFRGHQLNETLIKKIDVIECFNARSNEDENKKAFSLATKYKKPTIAGSDAHFYSEIGKCKVVLDSEDIKNEILKKKVILETNYSPSYMQPASQIIKSIKLRKYTEIPIQFISLLLNMSGKK